MSWQARLTTFIVRRHVRRQLDDLCDIPRVRAVFNAPLSPPAGARYTPARLGGVAGEWVESERSTVGGLTILYLHGGGFVGGSPRTHRPITAALALGGARVFVPDYRLAPEHPFPAAPDDARAVWQAVCDSEPDAPLALGGDSAGGNLALGLMLRLRDEGARLPLAAVLFSPATDLTALTTFRISAPGRCRLAMASRSSAVGACGRRRARAIRPMATTRSRRTGRASS